MVIQHNIPAINSHRYLGINNSKTAKNLEKLSSGFKINRAADDAAGLAISEKMRGQISGLGMAEQNANNGISLIQTAEGGLNETHSILQRMRELAVQSSNGTYQDEDRAQIELEYQALKGEIDRIASYTNYNGIKLLDGTVGGAMLSNTSAALKLDGTNAEVLDMMGVNTAAANAAPNFTVTAVSGDLTADDKKIIQDLPASSAQKVNGFSKATSAVTVQVTTGDGMLKDVQANMDLLLTADGSGGWAIAVSSEHDAFKGATASITNGVVTVTLKNAAGTGDSTTLVKVDLGTADAASSSALGGGYQAGSTISISTAVSADNAGAEKSSHLAGVKVNGESNNYATKALTTGVLGAGDITYSWNDKTQRWNMSGTLTLNENASTITERISFQDLEIDPIENDDGTVSVRIDGFTDSLASITLQFAQDTFITPKESELAAGTITMAYNGTALTGGQLAKVEGFKYDKQIQETPDKIRADRMLDALGLSVASRFDISSSLAIGTTEQKLLFEALNNKDAYIITRLSTTVDDKGKYAADNEYETVLQVNGESYIGKLEQGNWNFYTAEDKNKNSTLVATLTNANLARETGTIRFNTGDQNSQYYDRTRFLVHKEGAQIGSENVSELVFQIGANGAEDQRIGMYVLNMSSDNLGNHVKGKFVSESTILTRTQANEAVNTLDSAIVYVASQRAELGALQNRLEHTLNNLGVTKENLTAAESSIRDVDMAKEMMDFTKNNILVQAAQAMLAQANQLPQGVLQLLR